MSTPQHLLMVRTYIFLHQFVEKHPSYNLVLGLTVFSHILAVFSDPGIVRSFDVSEYKDQEFRWCKKCNQHKPDRAHHCKTCNR